MEKIISARHINKKLNIPPGIVLELLNDVNLTFYKGEFSILTGISGTGKSTLLGILLGYDKDAEGTVTIGNKSISQMDENEKQKFRSENIGICCADKAPIILSLTVKENIYNILKVFYDEGIEQKAEDILTAFKITSIADQKCISISSMDLYRLMLAASFCGSPPIVIIDEILDYFPSDDRRQVLETIRSMQKQHQITMILVTQEIEIIRQADRTINIMNHTTYEVDMDRLRNLTNSI